MLGGVCFCGDLILGHGSAIVPPAAGRRLARRLHELAETRRRARPRPARARATARWITDPAAKVAEYIEHRLARERALVAALDAGERSRARLLDAAWADVPEAMRPAAAIAMQAHLEKLAAEGRLDAGELID